MVMIGANGNKIAYGIKHYNVDIESDRLAINTFNLTPGTTVFVIENSKHYMLNGARKWVEIKPYGQGSSSNGGHDGGNMDDDSSNSNPGDSNNPGSSGGSYDGGDLDT